MSLSDAELFDSWRHERDAEAFKALTQRYGGLVYAAALRILGNAHEAEDVTQESFVSLATTSSPPRGAIAPWLHRVATNRALDRLRTGRNRQRREEAYADERREESYEPTWTDIFAYVDEAVNALPEKYRVPVVRHFYENCSGAGIAEELGLTRQAASYRIRKGVDLVRRALRKRGVAVGSAALAPLLSAHLAESAPIPASLSVTLGKLAIAGVLPPTAGAMTSAAATLGGLLVMKKALIGAAILLVALAGLWIAWKEPLPKASPAPTSYVAKAETPQPAEDNAVVAETTGAGSAPQQAEVPEPAAPQTDTATGEITGRIYDVVTGKGIAGVFPSFGVPAMEKDGPWRTASTRSDANGVYYLRGLKPWQYGLFPPRDLPGYPNAAGIGQTITVVANNVVRNVDFALEPGVAVDGTVLSKEGKAVEGATVTTSVFVYGLGQIETESDAGGHFTFCLPAGKGFTDLQARKDEAFSPQMRRVALCPEGVSGIVLTLSESATASISGVVVDSRNQPVPDALVELQDKFVPSGQEGLASAKTDAGGSFQIASLLAGSYQLFLARPNASKPSNSIMQVRLEEGEVRNDLRLILEDELFISGQVVNAEGKGIAKALVQAELKSKDRVIYESGTTQDDGRFTLSLTEGGQYGVGADQGGYLQLFSNEGPVVASGTSDVTIVLEPAGHIEGRVCDSAGNPITQFSLIAAYNWCDTGGIERALRYSGLASRVYHPEGRFEKTTSRRKTRLIAMAPGFAPLLKDVDVPPGETVTGVEFRLTPSRHVEGWVVDPENAAIPGAKIIFGTLDDQMTMQNVAAYTDSSGHFALDTLPDEIATLSAFHPSYGPGVARVEAAMRIVLHPRGCVNGRITFNGDPTPDGNITLEYSEEAGGLRFWQRASADGTYEFPSLPEGACQLTARDSNGNSQQRDIQVVSGQTLTEDFNFEPGGSTLQGRIIASGIAPESVELTLSLTGEKGDRVYRSRGNPDGSYQITGIEAGAGPIMAFVNDEEKCLINVEIPEDTTVEQDLALDVVGLVSGTVLGVTPDEVGSVIVLKGAVDLSGIVTVEDVQAFIPEATSIAVYRVQTDGSGHYEVRGLPYNTYTLIALSVLRAEEADISQWRWTAMQVVLDEGNPEMNVDFDLR